jgi:hypothetical protein
MWCCTHVGSQIEYGYAITATPTQVVQARSTEDHVNVRNIALIQSLHIQVGMRMYTVIVAADMS